MNDRFWQQDQLGIHCNVARVHQGGAVLVTQKVSNTEIKVVGITTSQMCTSQFTKSKQRETAIWLIKHGKYDMSKHSHSCMLSLGVNVRSDIQEQICVVTADCGQSARYRPSDDSLLSPNHWGGQDNSSHAIAITTIIVDWNRLFKWSKHRSLSDNQATAHCGAYKLTPIGLIATERVM